MVPHYFRSATAGDSMGCPRLVDGPASRQPCPLGGPRWLWLGLSNQCIESLSPAEQSVDRHPCNSSARPTFGFGGARRGSKAWCSTEQRPWAAF